MKTYIIKKLSETNDSELYDFYTNVYKNIKKSFIENLKWYYRIGYNNFEPIVIIVNNKIIGHAGLIPGEIEIKNKKYSVAWFTDFVILPEYRSKGYGKILTYEWMKICPHQVTFCNDKSLNIFQNLDWKFDLSANRNIYPINYFSITPVLKGMGLNIGNDLIRYFLKKRLNKKTPVIPSKMSKKIIQDLSRIKQKVKENTANIVRDESWLRWRLIETPYKDDIFFFEDNSDFIIGHIFYQNNLKRLNILYSNTLNEEKDIFKKVIKWSLENQIDFIWYITSSSNKSNNLFSRIFKKKLNFAFNSTDPNLMLSLKGGLKNAQGIDSDIDYIMRDR